jgi:hypothetical protein
MSIHIRSIVVNHIEEALIMRRNVVQMVQEQRKTGRRQPKRR